MGTYAVLASFAGSADYTSASASTTFTIIPATTISLSASATTLTYSQTVNLTATVTSTPTPSEGMVTFYNGLTTLGTGQVNDGTARLNNVLLPAGIDVITATYTDPLGNFGPSSTTLGSAILGAPVIIQTVAGNGGAGYSGDNSPATAATLNLPADVAVDAAGDIFIADTHNNVIREINAVTHIITTVVGDGTAAYSGDGDQATAASLNDPFEVALDAAGDLFIVDQGNDVIREVNAVTHIITTVAGNGTYGYSGDGGQATAASLDVPSGIALDSAGDIYIADYENCRILEVNAVTHIITTVAGNGTVGFSGDGGQATAAALDGPQGIALDAAGDLFIDDYGNERIREVNAVTQVITTIAGNGSVGYQRRWRPGHRRLAARSLWPCVGLGRRPLHCRHGQRRDPRGQRGYPCNFHRRGKRKLWF